MKVFETPRPELKKQLSFENPWWIAGNGIKPEHRDRPQRAYIQPFTEQVRELGVHQAVVLIVPRRIDKSVMLAQTIQELPDDGAPGIHIALSGRDQMERCIYNHWSELRGIRELAASHSLVRRPLVTTLTASGFGKEGEVKIDFMPTSLHYYTIARNLLRVA